MSKVIGFLERMGQDAKLRQADRAALELALSSADVTGSVRSAIVNANSQQLETLLGAKSNVCAIIFPVKDDDEENSSEDECAIRKAI